jgi:hypothetical protein
VRRPQARHREGSPETSSVHPAKRHARGRRRSAIRPHVVAHVESFPRPDGESGEGDLEDAGVGLREPATFGRDHDPEERLESRGTEARTLYSVDPIRDDPEEQAPSPELAQHRTAARQAVAAAPERDEVGRTHFRGLPNRSPQEGQQAAKALVGQDRLADGPLSVELPERFVDAPVLGENRRGTGEAEVEEALAQSASLGTIEIQEGPVEVENDGAGAKQG